MNIAEACKKVRRNSYLHGERWRVLFLAPTMALVGHVAERVKDDFGMSSMALKDVNRVHMTMDTERGTRLFFKLPDLDTLKGMDANAIYLCGGNFIDWDRPVLRDGLSVLLEMSKFRAPGDVARSMGPYQYVTI